MMTNSEKQTMSMRIGSYMKSLRKRKIFASYCYLNNKTEAKLLRELCEGLVDKLSPSEQENYLKAYNEGKYKFNKNRK